MSASDRLEFPATRRNREPILQVLRELIGNEPLDILEIASGSGEHAAFFAEHLPATRWTPSDPDPAHRASIAAWTAALPNVAAPLDLDVERGPWPSGPCTFIFNANMVHIAPFSAAEALFRHAASLLPIGGRLVLYGPFRVDGAHTAPSNEAFDQSLKSRDPRWGVRDLAELAALTPAAPGGPTLTLTRRVPMPANNFILVWQRVT